MSVFRQKIKPQISVGPEVKTNSQSPQFLNMICFILKLLKRESSWSLRTSNIALSNHSSFSAFWFPLIDSIAKLAKGIFSNSLPAIFRAMFSGSSLRCALICSITSSAFGISSPTGVDTSEPHVDAVNKPILRRPYDRVGVLAISGAQHLVSLAHLSGK